MNNKENDLLNVQRLQKIMDRENLDGLVASTKGNIYYLTGIMCEGLRGFPYDHQTYAVITRDNPLEPYYITTQGLLNQALDAFKGLAGVCAYGRFYRSGPFGNHLLSRDEQWLYDNAVKKEPFSNPLEALISVLTQLKLIDKSIGVDEVNLTHGYYESLEERLPNANIVQASKFFRQVRKVKTKAEVIRLQKVTQINELAIKNMLSLAKEGVTEEELAREYSRIVSSQGGIPGFICVRFGSNGVMAERIPDRSKLKPGEAIFIDVGCEYHGYWADFGRTACLGEPNYNLAKSYKAIKRSHIKAIGFVKPGMTGNDLFEFTVKEVQNSGLPHYKRHHVGHGIGLELYENVLLMPENEDIIEEGTVLNHESPYYEFGLGGLIIEDPFVVGENNNTLLTTISQDLFII